MSSRRLLDDDGGDGVEGRAKEREARVDYPNAKGCPAGSERRRTLSGVSLLSLGAISDFDLDHPRDFRSFRLGLVARLRGLLLLGAAVQCNTLYTVASGRWYSNCGARNMDEALGVSRFLKERHTKQIRDKRSTRGTRWCDAPVQLVVLAIGTGNAGRRGQENRSLKHRWVSGKSDKRENSRGGGGENTATGMGFIGRATRRERVFVEWIVTRVRCRVGVEEKDREQNEREIKKGRTAGAGWIGGYRRSSVKFR